MFWIVVCTLLAVLVIVFFDSVREHPLGTLLLLSSTVYFLWRSYTFLTRAPADDPLIWKILGSTAALMLLVGTIGTLATRRKTGGK
ncbi:MAG: hypothetical protein ACREIA_17505 [Opitutaceae bacterium]